MSITQTVTKTACIVSTKLFGKEGTIDYFILGQATIDLLDEAFDMHPRTGKYEYHILDCVDKWIGYYDDRLCAKFARFVNSRYHSDVTVAEVLECRSIDSLAAMLNRRTNRFFPEKCKYCVDKDK